MMITMIMMGGDEDCMIIKPRADSVVNVLYFTMVQGYRGMIIYII